MSIDKSVVQSIANMSLEELDETYELVDTIKGKRELAEAYNDLKERIEDILDYPDDHITHLDFDKLSLSVSNCLSEFPNPHNNPCFIKGRIQRNPTD